MTVRRRSALVCSTLIASAVSVAIVPLGSSTAHAEPVAAEPSSVAAAYTKPNCKRKPAAEPITDYWRFVRKGSPPKGAVLRCGTTKWGYRHFSKRWSKSFEAKISKTLAAPTKPIIKNGNTLIYCRKYKISNAKYYFKVVYSVKDVPGSITGNTGIITSTWDKKSGTCDKAA
ncbi:hypothetical protein ACFQU9_45380 [Actinomadura namibiensis]|uniref:Secreted protein n=1 Tax=Actinomadura namibiensis TaxID=182080 RepID=A0A7W3LUE7_ACTNM|nr:hypothetical protein [Actinomadura namibiensis]MBA8954484.1 hypothetical protein [Actinomadura namibiensis]